MLNICSKINPSDANVIVEYGPGTGVFFDYILKNFTHHIKKFILIEKNKDLYNYLRNIIRDKRVCIFNESTENVLDILISGYSNHGVALEKLKKIGVKFIHKPFKPYELLDPMKGILSN